MGPPDPIIGLADAYHHDEDPHKVILGVGAFRDDHGEPYVLPCVREAEKMLMGEDLDHEYSGIVSLIFARWFTVNGVKISCLIILCLIYKGGRSEVYRGCPQVCVWR